MIVTDVQAGKRNKNRVNIYIDGEYAFSCYLETALQNGIRPKKELSGQEIDQLKEEDGKKYAWDTGLRFVAAKMRTRKEIEDKLRGKEIEEKHASYAIDKLEEYGYIDDGRYAGLYAKELAQKYGKKMIAAKLAQKGIDKETASAALEAENGSFALKDQVERLNHRYREEEPQKKKQKMIRALLQKGFEYDEIEAALGGCHED